ncbi:unnamed protein product, partial [marine sediment metagenome]
MEINLLKSRLKEVMSEERFEHSVNTSEVARRLAIKYNYNTDKAR